jgi:uncharacterized membrane protein
MDHLLKESAMMKTTVSRFYEKIWKFISRDVKNMKKPCKFVKTFFSNRQTAKRQV